MIGVLSDTVRDNCGGECEWCSNLEGDFRSVVLQGVLSSPVGFSCGGLDGRTFKAPCHYREGTPRRRHSGRDNNRNKRCASFSARRSLSASAPWACPPSA